MLELTLNDHETYRSEAPLFEEELPMTLILGMMGSDGWLLAADTHVTEIQLPDQRSGAQMAAGHFIGDECKILSRPDLGVSYASAGSDRTREAGERLIECVKAKTFGWEDTSSALRRIGRESKLGTNPPFGSERLLIIFDNPITELDNRKLETPQLWKLDLGISVRVAPPEYREIGGDFGNAATLLPQLYYTGCSVERLIRLAAFTLWFAAKCNPRDIGSDLDILVGRAGKSEFVPESDLDELHREFDQFDATIANGLGFTLAEVRKFRPGGS